MSGQDYKTATLAANKLAELFEPYLGRKLLGVVDGHGVIELVFEDIDRDANLLCVYVDRGAISNYSHGGVADPEGYADRNRVKP
jgi:hypothetical protein